MPNIQDCAYQRLSCLGVYDSAIHVCHIRIFGRVESDGGALFSHGMVLSEERAKDGRLGGGVSGLVGLLEGDLVHKPGTVRSRLRARSQYLRFQTDHIANKLALVPSVCAHLACPVHELYAFHPFVHRQFSLARKVVDVSNQARHDLSHPRGRLRSHGVDDMVCEVWVKAGSAASAVRGHGEEWVRVSEVLVQVFSQQQIPFPEHLQ